MEYNDLSALSAIIYTLSSSSISRLKKTWEVCYSLILLLSTSLRVHFFLSYLFLSFFLSLSLFLLDPTDIIKQKVSKDSTAKFERLSEIVSPSRNYVKQRAMVATMQPPCVPFLGIPNEK